MNSMRNRPSRWLATALTLALAGLFGIPSVDAGRGGGGGARATAHSSVNRAARPATAGQQANRPQATRTSGGANRAQSQNVNRSTTRNVERNTSRSVNIDQDIEVDVDNDHWNDWDDHPVAAAAAVTAGVALTSAVIGSIVYSVPPSCVPTVVNNITYQQCGGTWYEPQYAGSDVQYVVVNPP